MFKYYFFCSLFLFSTISASTPLNTLFLYDSTLAVDFELTPAFYPTYFADLNNFGISNESVFLLWGGFISIILMMSANAAVLYGAKKEPIYLIYIAYLLSILTIAGVKTGYSIYLFNADIHQFLVHFLFILELVSHILLIFYIFYLFKLSSFRITIYRYSLILFFSGSVILLIFYWVYGNLALLVDVIKVVIYGWILFLIQPRLIKKATWPIYFFFAWLALVMIFIIESQSKEHFLNEQISVYQLEIIAYFIHIIFISLGLAERNKLIEQFRIYHTNHDANTALPTKQFLVACLNHLFEKRQTYTLIFVSIERYVDLKQTLPVQLANQYIQTLSLHIQTICAQTDHLHVFEYKKKKPVHLAHAEEEIFALIVEAMIPKEELAYLFLSIQEAITQPITIQQYTIASPCLVSAVSFPHYCTNTDDALDKAKQSLQEAQKTSQRYWVYSQLPTTTFNIQYKLLAELQQAMAQNQLQIFHQPQLDLSTQEIIGSEALLRWCHPTRGYIPPLELIQMAEKTGLINSLTEWIIQKALEQQAIILQCGYQHRISINISGKDLSQRSLIPYLLTCAANLNIQTHLITLELTESATVDDSTDALKLIRDLNQLDIKVAIDDFGTGYSSLEYLSKLPFHELKVDMSFVRGILTESRNRTITKATIEMAKHLGTYVVAEGIENKEIAQLLTEYGCDFGQGYYFSRPLSFQEYITWLNQGVYHST